MNDSNDQFDLPQLSDESNAVWQDVPMPPMLPVDDDAAQQSQLSQQQAIIGSIPVPEEANDLDLIEKEWVLKAKQIVEHTMDDPYAQQAEISKMKADYMKKRYSKDIKIAESK